MKYLCFIRHAESHRQNPPPAGLMKAMGEFVQRSLKNGSLVDTGGLLPSKDGVLISLRKGEITVKDGPFTESKELIAGFWLWQVKSMDEAVEWLKRAPFGGGVEIELRPIFEMEDFGAAMTDELKAQETRQRAQMSEKA